MIGVDVAQETELSAEIAALPTDRQRRFVGLLFEVEPGQGAAMRAARGAGYGTPTSSRKSISVIASRLMQDDRIQRAIAAESRTRLRALSPVAVRALGNLLTDSRHRHHARAVLSVVEKISPAEFHHFHDVQHRVADHDVQALDCLRLLKRLGVPRESLIEMFGFNGLPQLEQKLEGDSPKLIEASAVPAPPDDAPVRTEETP